MKSRELRMLPQEKWSILKVIKVIRDDGKVIAFLPYLTRFRNRNPNNQDYYNFDEKILESIKNLYPKSGLYYQIDIIAEEILNEKLETLFNQTIEVNVEFYPIIEAERMQNHSILQPIRNYIIYCFDKKLFYRVNPNINEDDYLPKNLFIYYKEEEITDLDNHLKLVDGI